jgi:diketogulonate reductase-like aldo/keto reductase
VRCDERIELGRRDFLTSRVRASARAARAREQWRALVQAKRDGLARAIGVSNYCVGLLKCLLEQPGTNERPAVLSQMHRVGMGTDPYGYVSWAQRLGIVYMAYSVLGT